MTAHLQLIRTIDCKLIDQNDRVVALFSMSGNEETPWVMLYQGVPFLRTKQDPSVFKLCRHINLDKLNKYR